MGDGKLIQLKFTLSIGTLQWGTAPVDRQLINSKGCISEKIACQIMHGLCLMNVTFFDIDEGCGGGTSEKRLGRCGADAFANSDMDALFMTKFLPAPWRGLTHKSFESALRASLKRLGISCCPMYLLHSPFHWRSIEFSK